MTGWNVVITVRSSGPLPLVAFRRRPGRCRKKSRFCSSTLRFLLQHASSRVPAFADSFLHEHDVLSKDCCRLLLEHDQQRYRPVFVDALKKEKNLAPKALVLAVLADHFPKEHTDEAKQANLAVLYADSDHANFSVEKVALRWLLHRFAPACYRRLRTICRRNFLAVPFPKI